MNKEWQDKLTSFGATVDSDGNVSFADEPGASGVQEFGSAINDTARLVDLSPMAVVDVTGPDAKAFLQAQVCNDLTSLSGSDIQINGYCTPKGRLLALFTVFVHEDGYRLLLPEGVAEAFSKRLQMFVMRAQVNINFCADVICSGLVFNGAARPDAAFLPAGMPILPPSALQVSQNEQMQIIRWHDAPSVTLPEKQVESMQQRYLCIADQDTMSLLWQSDAFQHRSFSYWRWGDINAGIPSVYASSTEQFIPQMLNMQLINALSFKKGCYPGQEIVARMQYLGKLKKHMKHLRVPDATDAPAPGEVLTTDSNNNAGQVVDAVVDEAGLNLLAVVNIETQIEALKLGDLGLVEAQLPYSLIADDSQAS